MEALQEASTMVQQVQAKEAEAVKRMADQAAFVQSLLQDLLTDQTRQKEDSASLLKEIHDSLAE